MSKPGEQEEGQGCSQLSCDFKVLDWLQKCSFRVALSVAVFNGVKSNGQTLGVTVTVGLWMCM